MCNTESNLVDQTEYDPENQPISRQSSMKPETNHLVNSISRRSALRTGAAMAGVLAFGGATTGTVQADEKCGECKAESENIIPVDLGVRAEDDSDPGSPKPDDDDLLVERVAGNPVDDGFDIDPDGEQLTWAEFSDVGGKIKVDGTEEGTHVELEVSGLVPRSLYTIWNVVFAEPGFVDDRDHEVATEHVKGAGPLGAQDGSENVFLSSDTGERTLSATTPGGELGAFGMIEDCALDEFEWHVIGALHLDGKTHGRVPDDPESPGTLAEQFAFIFQEGEPQ